MKNPGQAPGFCFLLTLSRLREREGPSAKRWEGEGLGVFVSAASAPSKTDK